MITFVAMSITYCKNEGKIKETNAADTSAVAESASKEYVADIDASVIEWQGSKPTGTHNGTISIKKGNFIMNAGKLQSGMFIIDMNSITDLDLEGKMKANLEAHLKGIAEGKEGDFFNVTKYPLGIFEITGSDMSEGGKIILSGNLTLKDIKNKVFFPATITSQNNNLIINSDSFTIDRTKWGVNFGSKTIFDNLGDKFINDDIELKITVKASKM